MKTVDVSEVDLPLLLTEVENGEEIVIARDGQPIARLTQPAPFERPTKTNTIMQRTHDSTSLANSVPFQRTPGIAANHPAWKEFRDDPVIFKALETDEELREEGWEV